MAASCMATSVTLETARLDGAMQQRFLDAHVDDVALVGAAAVNRHVMVFHRGCVMSALC